MNDPRSIASPRRRRIGDVRRVPPALPAQRAIGSRIATILAAVLLLAAGGVAGAPDPNKVLRVASPDIETLDPQQWSDDPSFQVQDAIFEPLYEWHYLASPPRLSPMTAAALPEISDSGRTWTIRVKPGIYFTDDPAFRGKPRELVAEDYVYSLKRWLDPNLARGGAPPITDIVVGARAVVDAASRPGATFDYDRPMAGLRALDRYTLQLKLIEPHYPSDPGLADAGRRRARGRRGRRQRHPLARGRNRALPAARVEARLADRARGESGLPRASLSRERRSRARGAPAQHAGQDAAADRRDRDQRDRRGPAAAARVRPRPARLHRAARRGREPAARGRQAQARVRGARHHAARVSRALPSSRSTST